MVNRWTKTLRHTKFVVGAPPLADLLARLRASSKAILAVFNSALGRPVISSSASIVNVFLRYSEGCEAPENLNVLPTSFQILQLQNCTIIPANTNVFNMAIADNFLLRRTPGLNCSQRCRIYITTAISGGRGWAE